LQSKKLGGKKTTFLSEAKGCYFYYSNLLLFRQLTPHLEKINLFYKYNIFFH